jgi:hypothetical protein
MQKADFLGENVSLRHKQTKNGLRTKFKSFVAFLITVQNFRQFALV